MSTIIENGRGTGEKMQVDAHGRAYVLANTVSHPAHHASYHKDFFYSFHKTTCAAATEVNCALIQGTSSAIELEVYSVLITVDQACVVTVSYDGLHDTGGESITPVNSNRTANVTLDASFYQGGASGDLVVTTPPKVSTSEFQVPAGVPFLYPIDGTVIIGSGTSLLFTINADAEATARITIGVTSHAQGVKL